MTIKILKIEGLSFTNTPLTYGRITKAILSPSASEMSP
jgi:hypothetical protein